MTRALPLALGVGVVVGLAGASAAGGAIAEAGPPARGAPSLDSGIVARVQVAARNLGPGGDRLTATRALDGARRLARVEASLVGCRQAGADQPLKMLRAARHALQNGRPREAGSLLDRLAAAATLSPVAACPAGASAAGKLIADSRGERIGRLVSLSPGRDAVLQVGGVTGLFGFFDFGGRRVTVPAGRLVEGKRMVVLLAGPG